MVTQKQFFCVITSVVFVKSDTGLAFPQGEIFCPSHRHTPSGIINGHNSITIYTVYQLFKSHDSSVIARPSFLVRQDGSENPNQTIFVKKCGARTNARVQFSGKRVACLLRNLS